jgi:hypothetical protein
LGTGGGPASSLPEVRVPPSARSGATSRRRAEGRHSPLSELLGSLAMVYPSPSLEGRGKGSPALLHTASSLLSGAGFFVRGREKRRGGLCHPGTERVAQLLHLWGARSCVIRLLLDSKRKLRKRRSRASQSVRTGGIVHKRRSPLLGGRVSYGDPAGYPESVRYSLPLADPVTPIGFSRHYMKCRKCIWPTTYYVRRPLYVR